MLHLWKKQRLGLRIGLATSASILMVSLAFFAYNYQAETAKLTEQLHEHMGENVATLTACLLRIEDLAQVQVSLVRVAHAFHQHVIEFRHKPRESHNIALLDENKIVLACTNPSWVGRPLAQPLKNLAQPLQFTQDVQFQVVLLDGLEYLFLWEPLEKNRSVLYLEPYSKVQDLVRASVVRNLAFSLLLSATLALVVNVMVQRLVTKRLELLASCLKDGNATSREIPFLGEDELGHVRDVYAKTLSELQTYRLKIEEYALTLEQQVKERTEQLVRASRLAATGEMAAGIAHGLNNPLASISASAEKLLDLRQRDPDEMGKRLLDHLQRILRNTERCKHITTSLLSFARDNPFHPQPVYLGQILQEAIHLLESEAESRGVRLHMEPTELPSILADPESLLQALANVISNAIDASPKGSEVRILAFIQGKEVVVTVLDQGEGISAQAMDKLFQPFYSTKPAGKGSGLGLAICRAIIEQLQGHVLIQSEEGKGALVSIHLPIKQELGA